jgi:hypothetical protein
MKYIHLSFRKIGTILERLGREIGSGGDEPQREKGPAIARGAFVVFTL